MAKGDFMDWLDRETARRGIDEKEIAALVDQMMVEDQLTYCVSSEASRKLPWPVGWASSNRWSPVSNPAA